jgi:alpha-galactosidase
MAIKIDDKRKYIELETANTAYQMCVDELGVLKHLWYGRKTGCSMEYLLQYQDVGFSGNPYDAGGDRTYSLDTLPLEYAGEGIGDFRVTAAAVTHASGSSALDLRVVHVHTKDGLYEIPGLPAVYAGAEEAQTLEVLLKDTATDVQVLLHYGVLPALDVITRSATFINHGHTPVTVTRAASLCLDIPRGSWEWINFAGRHTMERIPERKPLFHGIQESASGRGTSSHQQNPSVLLCTPDCTETAGSCIGAVLMYSGGFQTRIELDQLHQVRLVMGMSDEGFSWELKPQERLDTPQVILSYSGTGFETLSQNFHKTIREHVCRGRYQLAERPVLINNWEATYFQFDEEKLFHIAEEASKLGVDMLVMDDGWFGKRDDDNSGLGDWFVNEHKLNGGLKHLVDRVKGLGMQFGIWFEPEMISEDSDLFRAHPDWAIRIPHREPMRGRGQLVLDMTRKEVVDYLYQVMADILNSADITYVKWDMNRSISDWHSLSLTRARQGEMRHRYVLGVYELLERLTSAFPNVLFEGCSGGGGRFDAGMLYYCPQIWCSDDTDAFERTKIQYGTSFFYPISTVGSHVSTVPNHQTGRVVPIESRAVTAMAGSFGYEMDLNTLTEEEKGCVKDQIIRFKKDRGLIHNGRYYRLSNPLKDNVAAWAFGSDDGSALLVCGMIYRTEPNMLRYTLRLRGLIPDQMYRQEETGALYTGAALMEGGVVLAKSWGDDYPICMHFTAVQEETDEA